MEEKKKGTPSLLIVETQKKRKKRGGRLFSPRYREKRTFLRSVGGEPSKLTMRWGKGSGKERGRERDDQSGKENRSGGAERKGAAAIAVRKGRESKVRKRRNILDRTEKSIILDHGRQEREGRPSRERSSIVKETEI